MSSTPDGGLSSNNYAGKTSGGADRSLNFEGEGGDYYTYTDSGHDHSMGHTHDVTIAGHTHNVTVDDHDHGIAHTHDVTIGSHSHSMTHTHDVTIAAHTHDVTIAAHDHTVTIAAHSHGMAHDHTVPTLDLTYGMFEETIPASWSVTPKLYAVSAGGGLSLIHTFDPMTDQVERLDLTAYVTSAGGFMLQLQSDAAQPNNGRLIADIYGAIVGAIQSTN